MGPIRRCCPIRTRAIDRCGLEERVGRGDVAGVIDGAVIGKERAHRGDRPGSLDDAANFATAILRRIDGNRGVKEVDDTPVDVETASVGITGASRRFLGRR